MCSEEAVQAFDEGLDLCDRILIGMRLLEDNAAKISVTADMFSGQGDSVTPLQVNARSRRRPLSSGRIGARVSES